MDGTALLTYRLGLELGVDLVQAGVEASEGADVLLILPGHLLGFTLLDWDGRERTGGRSAWGYFFWFETVGTKAGWTNGSALMWVQLMGLLRSLARRT